MKNLGTIGRDKTGNPKVSIAFTSYNHAPYLKQAIDSVIAQTFEDWELLIWDDVSSDGSWEIIQSYSDPRIIPIRNEETKRYIYAINKTITDYSLGDYIAVHHSDDVWHPSKLELQVKYLDNNKNIDAIFTHVQIIDESNNKIPIEWFNTENRTRIQWLKSLFLNNNQLCHPSVLSRKSVYNKIGLYKPMLGQTDDAEMWTRLLIASDIYVIPEKLTLHRISSNGANVSSDTPQTRARLKFEWFEQKKHYLQLPLADLLEMFPEAEQWCAKDGTSDSGFVLAMIAIFHGNSQNTSLFGLDLLFNILCDPKRAAKIEHNHSFTYLDFLKLTAREELFYERQALSAGLCSKVGALLPIRFRTMIRSFFK